MHISVNTLGGCGKIRLVGIKHTIHCYRSCRCGQVPSSPPSKESCDSTSVQRGRLISAHSQTEPNPANRMRTSPEGHTMSPEDSTFASVPTTAVDTLPVKKDGLVELINCGTHSPLSTISRENPSPWLRNYTASPSQLCCYIICSVFANAKNVVILGMLAVYIYKR